MSASRAGSASAVSIAHAASIVYPSTMRASHHKMGAMIASGFVVMRGCRTHRSMVPTPRKAAPSTFNRSRQRAGDGDSAHAVASSGRTATMTTRSLLVPPAPTSMMSVAALIASRA